jgi:hypothetical protein
VFTTPQDATNHYIHYSHCFKVSSGLSAFWRQREEAT